MTSVGGGEADEGLGWRRIVEVELDERTILRRGREVEDERRAAIIGLKEKGRVRRGVGLASGAVGVEGEGVRLRLSVRENRLTLGLRNESGGEEWQAVLSLGGLRGVVRDYFLICESYYDEIKTATSARIESIDMSRRAVHDDGSRVLKERLSGKVEVDDETSRRLFTLICVLHMRGRVIG